MQTLGKIISRYINRVTCIFVTAILVFIVYIQIVNVQRQAFESARRTFAQMEQLLLQNQEELADVEEAYRETCLHNAEAIAYIIQNDTSVTKDVEELKRIAQFMEVDEIHIFDTTGRIVAGTHPEYYDYTFDSGEQMMFFKPMLEDKSLKLVQDITPNTAEAKMMQYSALWSRNGAFIVQVGMEPANVMKAREKNELSYLFALFRVNLTAGYYAVDRKSGEVVGSTNLESLGKNVSEIGLGLAVLKNGEEGFHAVVNNRHSYCICEEIGSNYILRVVSSRELYQRIPATVLLFAICLIVLAVILARAMIQYMDKYVVRGIHSMNRKLYSIARGNLDEMVDVESSVEFAELSGYINTMKKSLLDGNEKMSYVLSKTNMYIGVYEYNPHMKRVRFTEYVPRIFSMDLAEAERLSADYKEFKGFISRVHQNPVPDENSVFLWKGRYIRLEETGDQSDIFGVAIDVTDEIAKRKKIEGERDIDLLTEIYNRRGLEKRISALMEDTKMPAGSVLAMIDADGLKEVNDTYGHDAGDAYLKELARRLQNLAADRGVAARVGGDEFVLFLYRLDSGEALREVTGMLETLQEGNPAVITDDVSVPLRFSFGCSLAGGRTDYQALLKEADEKMYENKRERKAVKDQEDSF